MNSELLAGLGIGEPLPGQVLDCSAGACPAATVLCPVTALIWMLLSISGTALVALGGKGWLGTTWRPSCFHAKPCAGAAGSAAGLGLTRCLFLYLHSSQCIWARSELRAGCYSASGPAAFQASPAAAQHSPPFFLKLWKSLRGFSVFRAGSPEGFGLERQQRCSLCSFSWENSQC